MLELLNENVIVTEQSHLCFIMSEQPIELLLVKIKLMSETLLHCVTPNNNTLLERMSVSKCRKRSWPTLLVFMPRESPMLLEVHCLFVRSRKQTCISLIYY